MDRQPRDMSEAIGALARRVGRLERSAGGGRGLKPYALPVNSLGLVGTLTLYLRDHIVYASGELTGLISGMGTLVNIWDANYQPLTPVSLILGGSSLTATATRKVTISTAGVVRVADHNGGSGLEFNGLSYLTD